MTHPPLIKCVAWDLDDTLWNGVLDEGDAVELRPGVASILRELDERGVLQSIASRGGAGSLDRLATFGVGDCFLHPQLDAGPKSASLARLAERLGIGLDGVVLVDDQAFEREEVRFIHPLVRCFDPAHLGELLASPALPPRTASDGPARRLRYRDELAREAAASSFAGRESEFLATLDLRLTVDDAGPADLARAAELTLRTHQLNATGRVYDREALGRLAASPGHRVLVARLADRLGDYGTIGLALVETGGATWTLRLLVVSCRVLNRGAGGVFLAELMRMAHAAGVRLAADFVPTERNRPLYITYKLAGFVEIGRTDEGVLLAREPGPLPPHPAHVAVHNLSAAMQQSDRG